MSWWGEPASICLWRWRPVILVGLGHIPTWGAIWVPKEIRMLSYRRRAYRCRDASPKCFWPVVWIQIQLGSHIRHSPEFHAGNLLFLAAFPGWEGRLQQESAGRSCTPGFHGATALLCLNIPTCKMGTAPAVLHRWTNSSAKVVSARNGLYHWLQLMDGPLRLCPNEHIASSSSPLPLQMFSVLCSLPPASP